MTPIGGGGKAFDTAPLFDPSSGIVVRSAMQPGPGWWAGAPGANYDPRSNTFYLVYRQRQPRELGRGVECRIAASDNGVVFTDIWALPKTSFDALSLERCSLMQGGDGRWRLYISYVSPDDNRWRIAMMEAEEPDRFDPSTLEVILTAETTGTDGVKDPNVFAIGPMFYMLVSYAAIRPELGEDEQGKKHATGDVYNTGLTLSRSAAAISSDGRTFRWIGDVSPILGSDRIFPLKPQSGDGKTGRGGDGGSERAGDVAWDAYCRRIGSLLPLDSGGYLAFYDGSATVAENYEERTGMAITFDLRTYWSLSSDGPVIVSPHGTGSLRYIDVLSVGRELFYYYEMCRPDGSHELHVNVVERN